MNNITFKDNDGVEYSADLDKLIQYGYVKKIRPQIIKIKAGDLFKNDCGSPVLVIKSPNGEYLDLMFCYGEMSTWCSGNRDSVKEIIDYLNKGWSFVTNISSDIEQVISSKITK